MQRQIVTIAEHSVDLSIIKKGDICIDAGCRGFEFAKAMRDIGMVVKAFDLDYLYVPEEIEFQRTAIGDKHDEVYVLDNNDANAKSITKTKLNNPIPMIPLKEYVKQFKKGVSVIKLDIEGYEIPVVLSLEEPPAKQITIEWHLHTGSKHAEVMQCWDHLQELGYVMHFVDFSKKHGLDYNYWDTLFILQ